MDNPRMSMTYPWTPINDPWTPIYDPIEYHGGTMGISWGCPAGKSRQGGQNKLTTTNLTAHAIGSRARQDEASGQGKFKQVGHNELTTSTSYWEPGSASLGKSVCQTELTTGKPGRHDICSRARQSKHLGSGSWAKVPRLVAGNPGRQAIGRWARQSMYLG